MPLGRPLVDSLRFCPVPIPPDLEDPPGEPQVEPPLDAAPHDLPFGRIPWEDFEKLCLRLAKRESDVEDGRRFGTSGQSQSGIDIYARKEDHGAFVVYQCRRVATLTDADLRKAVDDFLGGEWAGKSSEFVFCTSLGAVRTEHGREIEEQRDRLRAHDPSIKFVVWDAEELSDRLREHPDLVEEFFGRAWLDAFLPEAARADVASQLTEMQETLSRVEKATTQRIQVFIFDWDPEQARKELRELAREDQELFAKLEDRIGNPPQPNAVVNVVEERPAWLSAENPRPWRILAHLAEKAGEWATATAAWREAAARVDDPYERAGVLVAAAATAGVGGDKTLHDQLLDEARELAPDHPRVRVQEVDQSLGGTERLDALEGVESDDPPVAALIACHRALAHLLLGEVGQARTYFDAARALNPRSAIVRMVGVNVTVQQARVDVTAHRRIDYPELKRALEEATSLLGDLREERRVEESVRVLMLAADILSMIDERKRARQLLSTATPEELATRDAGEVLGDAAIRALGWEDAIKFTEGAPSTPTVERIRACARAEIGSPRERDQAIATLEQLVSARGAEAPLAALFRLGLVTDKRSAAWSDEAAALLRAEGFESAADTAEAFFLDRIQRDHAAASQLLDAHGHETWALVAKLRLAGMRNDHDVMAETANALLDLGPAQDVVIEAARAVALTGDRERARQLLIGVAHDQGCPPAIRANAYAHLIPLVADMNDWEEAHKLHQEWIAVRPTDDRAFPWAPRIANRRR